MTLNGVMTVILLYFSKIGSFRGALRKSGWRHTQTFCNRNVAQSCLANVLCAVARPFVRLSVCLSVCLTSVVCLSVLLVHPTQTVVIFGNISTAFGTLAIHWHPLKISRRSSQGNPSARELNTRGVVKYSDFGLIDGYISETVQDRRQVSINHL